MSIQLNIPDYIFYEDEYIIVLNKPCSLMVEPDRNNHPNLLQQVKNYLKSSLKKGEEVYAQHIHRLDRPVSGIILFAKQKAVLKNLSEQFAERKVRKEYHALTVDAPEQRIGTLENWHRKEKKKALISTEQLPYSEKAILSYEVESLKDRFLWNIELQTGKYHQIRGQLSFIGCPIVGDQLYGSAIQYKPDSIALHACKLVFHHPITNEEMTIRNAISF